jgi:hypothetical protein
MSASLASSSWGKYEAAWSAYRNFETYAGFQFSWPLGRDACVGFVTWCVKVKKLKPSTAATYMSGIVKAHELRGLAAPPGFQDALTCIRGAKHLALPTSIPPRLPRRVVTLPMLKMIGHKLASISSWSEVDKQTVWACCVLAFFTSARVGELLANREDSFDPTTTLTWSDIKLRTDKSAILTLKSPKSGSTEFLDVFPFPNHGCCPMDALLLHMRLQEEAGLAAPGGPAFRLADGRNLTPSNLNTLLRTILGEVIDYSKESISCHSFRAGIASTLDRFPHLASSDDIRGWGRWDSACYTRYARLNLDRKRAIFKKIAFALNQPPRFPMCS